MSPSDVEVLLWCYCRPDPHDRRDAPAVAHALADFQERGLIHPPSPNGSHKTTEKGRAFVHLILSTPEPIATWVDPRTEEIIKW